MWFYVLTVLLSGVGIVLLYNYIFREYILREDGMYNDAYRGYLFMASLTLFFVILLSPLYMEFGGTPHYEKYIVSKEGGIEDLDVVAFTAVPGVSTFAIDAREEKTPIKKLSEVVVVDGESRILFYSLNIKHVQDPEVYWRLKQKPPSGS